VGSLGYRMRTTTRSGRASLSSMIESGFAPRRSSSATTRTACSSLRGLLRVPSDARGGNAHSYEEAGITVTYHAEPEAIARFKSKLAK
jgi:hypothetical protein